MAPYALFVIGPAGTGKTTFCGHLLEYYASMKRAAYYVNLDPASKESAVSELRHVAVMDIRENWSLQHVMQTYKLGPNGGLLHAMERFLNDRDYIEEKLHGYHHDEFLVVDCPGQMETYLHERTMVDIVSLFTDNNYAVAVAFLLDATFIDNDRKLVSGMLNALTAMLQLQLPAINIVTKMDLLGGVSQWDTETIETLCAINPYTDSADAKAEHVDMEEMMKRLLNSYEMNHLVPLDITDSESISMVATYIDHLLQRDEVDLSLPDNDIPQYLKDDTVVDYMETDNEHEH